MPFILAEKKENVLILKLNRPEVLNSFNQKMAFEMHEQLDEAANNSEIRAVLITGEGKAFCAGQDLAEVIAANGPTLTDIVTKHYNPIIEKIAYSPKPVICAVNGVAAGAGANIALACDIVLASSSASFIQAFSKIGLIPDSAGTFFLPRLVGYQRAMALMMTGDKVAANEAMQMGMIYKVVEPENLINDALALAIKISLMPTKALGYTKQLLMASVNNNLTQQLAMEAEMQKKSASTADYNEGVSAFLEKRKPNFTGE